MKNQLIFFASACVLALNDINALELPHCLPNGKGCCDLGTGIKMRSPGLIAIEAEQEGDFEGTITCQNGQLKCFSGLAKYRASLEGHNEANCPDFDKLVFTDTEDLRLRRV